MNEWRLNESFVIAGQFSLHMRQDSGARLAKHGLTFDEASFVAVQTVCVCVCVRVCAHCN